MSNAVHGLRVQLTWFTRRFCNSDEQVGSLLTPLYGEWLQKGWQPKFVGLPPVEDRFNNIGR